MQTTDHARRFLQQTLQAACAVERDEAAPLEAWLDAHTRHRTCVALAEERGLISGEEAAAWRRAAHGEEEARLPWGAVA